VRILSTICSLALLLVSFGTARAVDPYTGIDPYWILIHEPAVLDELKLTAAERKAVQKLTDELDHRFFPLRNKKRDEALTGLKKIISEAEAGLAAILRPAQKVRLNEILMRKLGTAALLREDVAKQVDFVEMQRAQIQSIIEETERAVAAIQKQANEGKPREPLEEEYRKLKTDEQMKILELLKPAQRDAWRKLVGPAFDVAKLGQPKFKAPELVDSGEWINSSSPLRLSDLRGQVAVVNFYACGCINCIRNYPWYREWHEKFKDKGVVLIGIHTPETSGERESATVRRKAAEEKLAYPLLIDGKSENWNAWGNSMWPSVYLIDKQGYLREFWPGELKWQGNDGEKHMREKIEQLLAENAK
jgi:peroxiredoxin